MDFTSAALLVSSVYVIIKILTASDGGLVPNLPKAIVPLLSIAVGIGGTMLVAHTAWAGGQVIDKVPLSQMNGASQVLVGILLGAGATGLDSVLKTVRNVGANDQ